MRKPTMWGMKLAQKTYPLIEIIGPVDIGKRFIAKLVARRLQAAAISFPVFDQDSITGSAMLAATTSGHNLYEELPAWWAHIYAAHLYEYGDYIRAALRERPVVVTNYLLSFRYWNSALGAKTLAEHTAGFFPDLPIPTRGYSIIGATRDSFPGNLEAPVSEMFKTKLTMGVSRVLDSRIKRVYVQTNSTGYKYVNEVACSISKDLCEHFKLKENPFALYKQHFELL